MGRINEINMIILPAIRTLLKKGIKCILLVGMLKISLSSIFIEEILNVHNTMQVIKSDFN